MMAVHRPSIIRTALAVISGILITASTGAQSYTFTTFAGDTGTGSTDGTGSAARFNGPNGVATDGSGNVYVADRNNYTIRRITPAGVVTTIAGLAGGSGSADGAGSTARFSFPNGVATDINGNVYVADSNHTIRKITPAGDVTTLAGSAGMTGSTNGIGSAARFYSPNGVATDPAGNVYVADTNNNTIRKITPAGEVTTLAGMAGVGGFSTDGTGSTARFNNPTGVATDSSGNVYVADRFNHTIRKITPAAVVTTLAGSAGSAGYLDETGSAARFQLPEGVATDSGGNVYVAESGNMTIRKITPAGVVTTLAGSTSVGSVDGTGGAARFSNPRGVATDGGGNVYVADSSNQKIRKITPIGDVTTLAGLTIDSGSADGTGSAARFRSPAGVATDSSGNVYVADETNHTIRKITTAGVVTTLAGLALTPGSTDATGSAARFRGPIGVATDGSANVYVADETNHTIRKITPAGVVTTLAGLALTPGSTDATGSAARFRRPNGVATDGSGNVYVADRDNHTIRMITPAGVVTTLAGLAGAAGSVDGTGSAARFRYPTGVATDSSGNVYVADRGDPLFGSNHTIRMITPAGVVTTLAGLAGAAGSVDGSGSAARFNFPAGVATDSSGNVYVADTGNNTIRAITPTGAVTTLGGLAIHFSFADGTGSVARFNNPRGVTTDGSGNLYIADEYNHLIRVARVALPDTAMIDSSTGTISAARQLSTAPNTASTWQWSIERRPGASSAPLSSTSIRNPVFTPDAGNLYTFRLVASNGTSSSITTVDLTVAAPVSPDGDANGDGVVTGGDVFYLINNLFANGPVPIGPADVNGDNQLTVIDIFYLINVVFAGG